MTRPGAESSSAATAVSPGHRRTPVFEAHDVFSLGQAPDGAILAGTRHGIYRLQTGDLGAKVDKVSLVLPVAEPPAVAKAV